MIIVTSLDQRYNKVRKLGEGAFGAVYLMLITKGLNKGEYVSLKIFFSKPRISMMTAIFPKDSAYKMEKIYETEMYKSLEKTVKLVRLANENGKRKDVIVYKNIIYETKTRNFSIEMNYIPGVTLTDFEKKYLSDKDLFFIAKNLLCSIISLHEKHIAHRDIKPDNIMFNPTMKQLTLIDFGVSCMTSGKFSHEYSTCRIASGTPFYMHPSIYERWEHDVAWEKENWKSNDIYGWAVSMWEIASNKNMRWLQEIKKRIIDQRDLNKIPSASSVLFTIMRKKNKNSCSKNGKSI